MTTAYEQIVLSLQKYKPRNTKIYDVYTEALGKTILLDYYVCCNCKLDYSKVIAKVNNRLTKQITNESEINKNEKLAEKLLYEESGDHLIETSYKGFL